MKPGFKLILSAFVLIAFASSFTFAQEFGKNKVQYQNFTWKYITSAHFDVYYSEGSKYLGEFTAFNAEESLKSIQDLLNYRLNTKVIIIVYDSKNEFQQSNVVMSFLPEGIGGVTEMLKNRVILPFMGDFAQFKHVIHHELVHAVLNDMFYGGTIQSSLSAGITVQIPIWVNEGLAEYESIGGLDPQTDMFMRDLTISEKLPPLNRLDGFLAYRGGQTFFWYIANKYGKERVGEFINRLRVNPTIEATFKSTFHQSLEDFSDQWQKDMKKYYWTDLAVFKDPADFSTVLTNHQKDGYFYNTSPSISPNGDKMAFISDRDGLFTIYVQDLENKENVQKIASSYRAKDFEELNILTPGISWNPQGTKLAISAKSGGEDAIYLVDVKTEDYKKLLFGIKSITSVVWSPDGTRLAFVGSNIQQNDIFIYDLKTEKLVNITNDIFSDFHPVWSRDSKKIYFISDRGDHIKNGFNAYNYKMWDNNVNMSDIYSIDVATQTITRITNDPQDSKTSMAVSPDDKKILYVADNNGIGNIYELDLATGAIKPKTNSLNGITQISLSNDGSKLLYAAEVKGGYDIYMMRFPFEKNLDTLTLPLTKLKQKELEENEFARKFIAAAKEGKVQNSAKQDLAGYGNFDVEFSRQQVIRPNQEIAAGPEKQENPAKNTAAIDTTEHDYKLKFTPDIILGNPGYSTFWGVQGVTQMLFSDIMGDNQIFFQANLLLDLRNSAFYFEYDYLPDIIDYRISGFHQAGFVSMWTDPRLQTASTLYRFRKYGGSIFASYPFDMFNRIEWGLNIWNATKENIDDPSQPSISRLLLMPEGKYVHDDVLYGPFYAPVRGSRYYLGFKGSPKLTSSGHAFMTLDADYRYYYSPWNSLTFALRGTGALSLGPNPQNFYLGGTDTWMNPTFKDNQLPFNDPLDFALMPIVMPLRGYEINQISGSKYFLTNIEARFPLIGALIAGEIPLLLQAMEGVFFMDLGGAWNNEFRWHLYDPNNLNNNLLMGTGVGLRTILLGLPFKLDVAWRNQYGSWSTPVWMVSLGFDY